MSDNVYLTETVKDVYWTFILPFVCILSIGSNMINIVIFGALKTKNIVYKFMFLKCMCDVAYLFCVMFVFIMRCGQFCQLKDSYLAMFYYNYIYMYAANSLNMCAIFIEIFTAIQRIVFITNKTSPKHIYVNLILVSMLSLSFLYNLPRVFAFEIKPVYMNETKTMRRLVYTRENIIHTRNYGFRLFMSAQVILIVIIGMSLFCTLNFLTWHMFKKHLEKKRALINAFHSGLFSAKQQPEYAVNELCLKKS